MDKRVYWHRKYQTRDGHLVFITTTNGEDHQYPVTGTMMVDGTTNEELSIIKFSAHGIWDLDCRNNPLDLVEEITHG